MHTRHELELQSSPLAPLRAAGCSIVISLCTLWLTSPAFSGTQGQTPEIPVVRADAGPCSADFSISDSDHKPLYDAKIQVQVRYGFMSKRKTDLEVGTNSDGKARIEGLPERARKPLEFRIHHGDRQKSVSQDPSSECHAKFTVVLAAQ